MKIQEIKNLQIYLNSKGYPLVVDGKNGPKTKGALTDLITKTATKNGVEPVLALAVATCEGGMNPYAINQNTDKYKSIDRGLYQFNSYWFPNISATQAFDVEVSTKLFCQQVRAGNLIAWKYSMPNWKKMIPQSILNKYIIQK